jgi:hypothetical protein
MVQRHFIQGAAAEGFQRGHNSFRFGLRHNNHVNVIRPDVRRQQRPTAQAADLLNTLQDSTTPNRIQQVGFFSGLSSGPEIFWLSGCNQRRSKLILLAGDDPGSPGNQEP